MFITFWELHSGQLWGTPGIFVVDLFGLAVILISVTGLFHFFFPKLIRHRKRKDKKITRLVSTKRKNLRWHNVVGYIFVLFLVINTFAGMHLRPPLLIAIADKQVGILPYTDLDRPNPWYDKLRRVTWDDSLQKYIISTSDGFYYTDESLTKKLQPFPSQPPVSVMGCNVLEKLSAGKYLVGSFSGMFVWDMYGQASYDYFTGKRYQQPEGMARPIADNMVAGLAHLNHGQMVWFDYNRGALTIASTGRRLPSFPEMPKEIIRKSPMPLWNVALETHTGRIFEKFIGPFYILYVPIAGICVLIVLISGFFMWWLGYRKRR